jgi:hypothetical protein
MDDGMNGWMDGKLHEKRPQHPLLYVMTIGRWPWCRVKAPRWVSSQSGLTFGYVSPPLGFIYPKPQGKGYMNLNIQKSQGERAGVLLLLLLLLYINKSHGKNSPLGHTKKTACKTCAKYFLEKKSPKTTIISRGEKLKSPYLDHGFLHIANIYIRIKSTCLSDL